MIDLRDSFVDGLIAAARRDERIVVLDADVSRTSRTRRFRDAFPDRFYDMGIAEQNMVGTAAGLASAGLVPFAVTFSIFLSLRAAEQIRTSVCYPNLPVKLIGGYAALSNAKDGATHQSLEDIAVTRSFPNLNVVTPSDPGIMEEMIESMIAHAGPVYMRLEYMAVPEIRVQVQEFHPGKGRRLRTGKDASILSCGTAVHRALKAAEFLGRQGLHVEVIDMASLKPLDEELVLTAVSTTGKVVCLEDHGALGGLSEAVGACIARSGLSCIYRSVSINDTFTESGSFEGITAKYQVSTEDVVQTVLQVIEKDGGKRT